MDSQVDKNIGAVGTMGGHVVLNQYFVRGVSPAMRALERAIAEIAPTEIPVLLAGESGTGKEVAAIEIHRLSRRFNEAFVKCGCAGLSPDLLSARIRCGEGAPDEEMSGGGSLYLDEINQMELSSQARLVNLLPEGNGTPSSGCLSVRLISSTTRNLEDEMRAGRFREELFYRINGVHLRLPPLRDRKEDIPALLDFFFKKYASLFGRPEPQPAASTMSLLLRYNWPGNIRELENVARKMVALDNEQLAIHDLAAGEASHAIDPVPAIPKMAENGQEPVRSLKQAAREASRSAERELILSQLERTHWNRKRTARELQISYKALLYKLKQLGLDCTKPTDKQ